MTSRLLVDTGPLVALLDRNDSHHAWAVESLGGLRAPLLTCEAVLTEAAYLLRRIAGGPESAVRLVRTEIVAVAFRLQDESEALSTLMRRYAAVPMSLADACLVRMSELQPDSVLATLDADFRIYRRNGRQVIPLLAPARKR